MSSINGTLPAHTDPRSAHAGAGHGLGRISLSARGHPAGDGLPGAPLRPVTVHAVAGGTPEAEPPAVPERSVAPGPIRGRPAVRPEAQGRAPRGDPPAARLEHRE